MKQQAQQIENNIRMMKKPDVVSVSGVILVGTCISEVICSGQSSQKSYSGKSSSNSK